MITSNANDFSPLEILYEDNHLLAIAKPCGVSTQNDESSTPSLEEIAKAYLKKIYQKSGNVYLEPVHRIDKPVSGIVLFAKTSKALSRLHESIRKREMKKCYIAILENCPKQKEGFLEHLLVHDFHIARIVEKQIKEAKLARLKYKVVASKENLSFVFIELMTGRYHQIRTQFSYIHCPIYGDTKYGSKNKLDKRSIALHHLKMTFEHPVKQQFMTITSPLPKLYLDFLGKDIVDFDTLTL